MSQLHIATAIHHHGALRKKAQAAGMSTEEYAKAHQGDKGLTGEQARLGITLMKLSGHMKAKPKPKVTIGSNAGGY